MSTTKNKKIILPLKTTTFTEYCDDKLIELPENIGQELNRGTYGIIYQHKYNENRIIKGSINIVPNCKKHHEYIMHKLLYEIWIKFNGHFNLLQILRPSNSTMHQGRCYYEMYKIKPCNNFDKLVMFQIGTEISDNRISIGNYIKYGRMEILKMFGYDFIKSFIKEIAYLVVLSFFIGNFNLNDVEFIYGQTEKHGCKIFVIDFDKIYHFDDFFKLREIKHNLSEFFFPQTEIDWNLFVHEILLFVELFDDNKEFKNLIKRIHYEKIF